MRWMPRHQKAMKDVAGCDKLRGAAKQALNRRFPNAETRYGKPISAGASHRNFKFQISNFQ